jgi:hypothetical protein
MELGVINTDESGSGFDLKNILSNLRTSVCKYNVHDFPASVHHDWAEMIQIIGDEC